MTISLITPIDPVPVRGAAESGIDYQNRVDAFTSATGLPRAVGEMNDMAEGMNALAPLVDQVFVDADQVAADRAASTAIFNDIVNATNSVAVGTSTASVTIGTGSKSFAAGAGTVGKIWPLNAPVFAVSQTDATKSMWGKLTAYNPTNGAFTMNSQVVGTGTGTVTDWVIYLGLPQFMIAPNTVLASKTDTASTTSTSWADTGLEVSITLKDAASKVAVRAFAIGSANFPGNAYPLLFRLARAGTPLAQGDAASTRSQTHFAILSLTNDDGSIVGTGIVAAGGEATDTPGSVGPHTYKLQWRLSNSGTGYLNRSASDGDSPTSARGVSTISATEIA